jgi:diacylglycerol diphosphate phosphatase/phosphatidate phosphatase
VLIKTSDLVVLSLSLAGSFTQVIKITVGRPRPGKTQALPSRTASLAVDPLCPDLISRCNPDPTAVDPNFGLSTVAICHQSDRHIINDGFKSFPSGHSSCAVYLERSKRMH